MGADHVEGFLQQIVRWAERRSDIGGLLLVGSWARGTARPDSDVDLMFLVEDPGAFRTDTGWMAQIGLEVSQWRDEDYGAAWSRHVYLENGSRLELSFGTSEWAKTDPVDAGTFGVISDGGRILYDPEGALERLLNHVRPD